jgi:hypothetical protein
MGIGVGAGAGFGTGIAATAVNRPLSGNLRYCAIRVRVASSTVTPRVASRGNASICAMRSSVIGAPANVMFRLLMYAASACVFAVCAMN